MPENIEDQSVPSQDPNAGSSPTPVSASPVTAPAPAPDLAKIVGDLANTVNTLAQKMDTFTSTSAQPVPGAPAQVDDLDQEIKLRQEQLGAIDRGELDSSYRAAVQTALSSAVARKEGRSIVERENMRGGFVQEYNQNLQAAFHEFKELAEPNSELAKETNAILQRSPAYQRAVKALNTRGRDAEKVDWGALDSRITISAAREAHSIISRRNAGRPLSTQQGAGAPRAAQSALESGSGAAPLGEDELARLEARAIESGSQSDWRAVIKARDNRLKHSQN